MTPNEIKAHMLLSNVNAQDIAVMAGLDKPHQVYEVIRNKRPTAYIREAIAKAINKPVHEIWPEQAEEEAA